ncbi:MAG: hypothetical protein PF961_01740 [Planctomycetota bacterium]|jgi:hypothetical protein|nr:hypothetical protein [Planctomycetota bacterium]
MPRSLSLIDDHQRCLRVRCVSRRGGAQLRYTTSDGSTPNAARLIKTTTATSYPALQQAYGTKPDALAQALIDADPEVPLELLGGTLDASRLVALSADHSVLESGQVLTVHKDADGQAGPPESYQAQAATTGAAAAPLPWTGRRHLIDNVIRRHALVRKLQLRHDNDASYDALHALAQDLHSSGEMLELASGETADGPLVLSQDGKPYTGFLEGRVDGSTYRLVLHLSDALLHAASTGDAS